MFLGAFVTLSVCVHDYSKTNKCILMKFFIWGQSDQGKKWLSFGKDANHTLDTKLSVFSSPIFSDLGFAVEIVMVMPSDNDG